LGGTCDADHLSPAHFLGRNRFPMSPSTSQSATNKKSSFSTVEMLIQAHNLTDLYPAIQTVIRLAPVANLTDELAELGLDLKMVTMLTAAIKLDQDE